MVVTNSDTSKNPRNIEVGDTVYVKMKLPEYDISTILYATIKQVSDGYKLFGSWIKEDGSVYAERAFCNATREEIFKVVRREKNRSVFSIRTTKAVLTKW